LFQEATLTRNSRCDAATRDLTVSHINATSVSDATDLSIGEWKRSSMARTWIPNIKTEVILDVRERLKIMVIDEVGYNEHEIKQRPDMELVVIVLEHLVGEVRKAEDHKHTIY
jgi:hypothetical protein